MKIYQDEDLDFTMTYPSSWQLIRNERLPGEVILEKDPSVFDDGSIRIALDFRNFMGNGDYSSESVVRTMTHTVNNLEETYGNEFIHVINAPYVLETIDNLAIVKAVVSRDTSTFPIGSPQNRIGNANLEQDQIIALYWLTNTETEELVTIRVYYGSNEEVNHQADQVIKSIRFLE